MAIPLHPAFDLNTTVATVLDVFGRNPANTLTDSGEKLHNALLKAGRIFLTADCEKYRYPLRYGMTSGTQYYDPDKLSGTPDAGGGFTTAAQDFLTNSLYQQQAASANINMPQSQPEGNIIPYVTELLRTEFMLIWNEEEQLFLSGDPNGGSNPTYETHSPFSGDSGFVAGYPMNLRSILLISTDFAAGAGGTAKNGTTFAGIQTNDVAKHMPHLQHSATPTGADLFKDLDNAIGSTYYSERERVNYVLMVQSTFNKFRELHRDFAALPDPVGTNIGSQDAIRYGNVTVDWTRYLDHDTKWDFTGAAAADAPIVGMNLNSLRLNVVVRPTRLTSGELGYSFIRQIGADMYPHATLTNVFKRIEWKRQFALDNGRRSFFQLDGITA